MAGYTNFFDQIAPFLKPLGDQLQQGVEGGRAMATTAAHIPNVQAQTAATLQETEQKKILAKRAEEAYASLAGGNDPMMLDMLRRNTLKLPQPTTTFNENLGKAVTVGTGMQPTAQNISGVGPKLIFQKDASIGPGGEKGSLWTDTTGGAKQATLPGKEPGSEIQIKGTPKPTAPNPFNIYYTSEKAKLIQQGMTDPAAIDATISKSWQDLQTKLIENRYPVFTQAGANLPPGYTFNRRNGSYEWHGEGPAPGMTPQDSMNWQALKKSVQTVNGPVFKRLIDQAEILAVGVVNPKTGQQTKPELDQLADLRDAIPDRWLSKISSDFQAFNKLDQFLAYKVSDKNVANFISKMMANTDTLANIYAGGGTVTSDFKMKFAKDLFESALSKETFRAKMDTHKDSVLERSWKFSSPNPAGVVQKMPVPGVGVPEMAADGSTQAAFNNTVPQAAIDYLKAHPDQAAAFDAKYGNGAKVSQHFLGGK